MDGRRARALLGVGIDAGSEEIRRAFRTHALQSHPDRGGDRVEFELMVLAFETLQHVEITSCGAHREEVRLPVQPTLPGSRPRIDVFDSPRRISPQRCFDDALRAAMGRPTL